MARSSNVNADQVAEACAALFLEGRNTSFDSVYELIGRRGSAKVVQGFIADWRKTLSPRGRGAGGEGQRRQGVQAVAEK